MAIAMTSIGEVEHDEGWVYIPPSYTCHEGFIQAVKGHAIWLGPSGLWIFAGQVRLSEMEARILLLKKPEEAREWLKRQLQSWRR